MIDIKNTVSASILPASGAKVASEISKASNSALSSNSSLSSSSSLSAISTGLSSSNLSGSQIASEINLNSIFNPIANESGFSSLFGFKTPGVMMDLVETLFTEKLLSKEDFSILKNLLGNISSLAKNSLLPNLGSGAQSSLNSSTQNALSLKNTFLSLNSLFTGNSSFSLDILNSGQSTTDFFSVNLELIIRKLLEKLNSKTDQTGNSIDKDLQVFKDAATNMISASEILQARNVMDSQYFHLLFPWFEEGEISFFDMKVNAQKKDKKNKEDDEKVNAPASASFDLDLTGLGPVKGLITLQDSIVSFDLSLVRSSEESGLFNSELTLEEIQEVMDQERASFETALKQVGLIPGLTNVKLKEKPRGFVDKSMDKSSGTEIDLKI